MIAKTITAWQLVVGLGTLSAISALVAVNQAISPWFALPIVLPAIVVVPGCLALMALRIHTNTSVEYGLYAIGMSLAFWIVGGLMLNQILPVMGVAAPLSIVPLTAFFIAAIGLLGIVVLIRQPTRPVTITLHGPRPLLLIVVLPGLLVLASVMGANILNNGGSGALTLAMLFCVAAYVLAAVSLRSHFKAWGYIFPVFAISLALLLMYSLRSWHILGWDIHGEFAVFQATLSQHAWSMNPFLNPPYNSCLSITILPTILQEFTHVQSEYVFKLVYQIIFALSPVVVYSVAVRYMEPCLAFIAAIVFASQTSFYEQMPALIRQEVALLFFAMIVLLMFDRHIRNSQRLVIFVVFMSGLVLSHYSTAYICIVMLFLASLLSTVVRHFWPRLASDSSRRSPLDMKKVLIAVLILVLWQGAVTHTLGSAAAFVKGGARGLDEAFSTAAVANGFARAFLGSPDESTKANLEWVYAGAVRRSHLNASELYPPPAYPVYVPTPRNDLRNIAPRIPHLAAEVARLLGVASKAALTNVLCLVGTAVILVRLRKRRVIAETDYGILSLATIAILVSFLAVPYFQQQYNLTRMYLQAMSVLSVASVVGLWFILEYVPRFRYALASVLAAFSLLFMTGALNHVIGGQVRITTEKQSVVLDRLYTYDQEIASAQWLSRTRDHRYPVYADVIANLRLQSYANLNANQDMFPATISRDGYVYLDVPNVDGGYAFYAYHNATIVSGLPLNFLNAQKDIIYSSGGSVIYR